MNRTKEWIPDLRKWGKPYYRAIADAIAEGIREGRLAPLDRLPPQRILARQLGLNFTTVARGYVEATQRGLIESKVGQGSFIKQAEVGRRSNGIRPSSQPLVDLTMNLPPEPDDPALLGRMQRGLAEVGKDMHTILRYQGFGGSARDKDAAVSWLSRRGIEAHPGRLLICPGAHSALVAVLGVLARQGDVICAEALTYPGVRAIAAQLGLRLIGLPLDDEGIDAEAFAAVCEHFAPKALYLNPTVLNPTTQSMSLQRRQAVIEVARRHRVAIVEDDAYGLLPEAPPPAIYALAPELTYYVKSLAKCMGAGLRLAYLVAPDVRAVWPLTSALRTMTVMASPLTTALATHWIEDGVAGQILAAIREESWQRQKLLAEILPPHTYRCDPAGFHVWIPLPPPWTRSSFASHMRASGIGVVTSDAFATTPDVPEAVRLCLGGVADREQVEHALRFVEHALLQSPITIGSVL